MGTQRTVRYGVVGLGHIVQVAVMPAFAHARRNSELVAIVSGDRTKRRELARRYRIQQAFTYEALDECLRVVDAVYIALPNSMHAHYAIRAVALIRFSERFSLRCVSRPPFEGRVCSSSNRLHLSASVVAPAPTPYWP